MPGLQEKTATVLLPPLKWAGGKRWLVAKLKKIWRLHSDKRLVEPFVGGMAVALGLLPEKAFLSEKGVNS